MNKKEPSFEELSNALSSGDHFRILEMIYSNLGPQLTVEQVNEHYRNAVTLLGGIYFTDEETDS